MKITIDTSVPEALIPIIEERFTSLAHFCPGWCNNLVIVYSHDNPGHVVLSCASEYKYRFMQVCVYDLFFREPEWEEVVLHEFAHGIAAPYSNEWEKLLELSGIPEDIKQYATRQMADAEEAFATDLADFATKVLTR